MPSSIKDTNDTTTNKADKNSSLCGVYSVVRGDISVMKNSLTDCGR